VKEGSQGKRIRDDLKKDMLLLEREEGLSVGPENGIP